MTIKEFSFNLPPHLIAQTPADKRGEDRLLVLDRGDGSVIDEQMHNFASYIDEGSIVVVNNSKVRKARVYATSDTGSIVEFLFLEENLDNTWQCMVTKAKRQKVGKHYTFSNKKGSYIRKAWITKIGDEGTRTVAFEAPLDEDFFRQLGHVPLPPYIKRDDSFADEKRYQTIYADPEGSVAAPTAGLHFTEEILASIKGKGCRIVPITLHVGPGTFLPVRTEHLDDHKMHYERYEIREEAAKIITQAHIEGRKIIATGTTCVRTLESAFNSETQCLKSGEGRTNLFIRPGYQWKVVTQILTNFHTPESTLLVLVSTFAGKQLIDCAYQHAVDREYRFFSYGDAMFIR